MGVHIVPVFQRIEHKHFLINAIPHHNIYITTHLTIFNAELHFEPGHDLLDPTPLQIQNPISRDHHQHISIKFVRIHRRESLQAGRQVQPGHLKAVDQALFEFVRVVALPVGF